MISVRTAALIVPVLLVSCASTVGGDRPAWELPPPPVREAPVVRPGSLHRAVLENGMHILVIEDRRLPRVELGMTFRRGELSVPRAQAGLAPFTAELLKRGADDLDALAFAESVDEIGASFGTGVDWDSLSIGVAGLSRDLDRLFEVMQDVVRSPRFEPSEATRARDERLAAIERAKDQPETLASWHIASAVYPDHRFGQPIAGTAETVAKLDAAQARAFFARVALPENAIFYVSGDVSAEDVMARARRGFADWLPGDVVELGDAPPAQSPVAREIVIVNRPDLGQARIVVSHEGIARTSPDRVETGLMNSVLGGGGFSSRLFRSLRADEGLTYGVSSRFSLRREPGPFAVSTFTRVEETRHALDLLLAEIERMRVSPPTEEELGWARTLAIGRFSMGLETSSAVMDALVDLDLHGLPEDALDTYRSRVRARTTADLARAATDHLHPERAAIALVGPAEQLVPLVEDLGPVRIVEP